MTAPLLLALLGCSSDPELLPLGSVKVAAARLEGFDLAGFSMFAGGGGGTAELVVESVDGEEFEVPVNLSYGTAGMLMDFAIAGAGTVEIGLPPREVRGDELFGTYRGGREALVMLVGAVGHHLENEAGLRIDKTTLGFGLSVMVGVEWLTVKPELSLIGASSTAETGETGESEPTGETGHTGAPATGDTGVTETGDTGS